MSGTVSSAEIAREGPRRFFLPSLLLVLIADLIPAAGILFWGWDAFVLLVLYWLETAVIAFWTLARVLTVRKDAKEENQNILFLIGGRLFLTVFFLVHSSIFMAGHFVFLWAFFSGKWSHLIHTPREFWDRLVLGYQLWAPLGISFIGRGFAFFRDLYERMQKRAENAPLGRDDDVGNIVGGLYSRIILMHVVILSGAWIAEKLGSAGPYLLLIAIKTGFDLFAQLGFGRRGPQPMKPG